jgi:hypothetical protein
VYALKVIQIFEVLRELEEIDGLGRLVLHLGVVKLRLQDRRGGWAFLSPPGG